VIQLFEALRYKRFRLPLGSTVFHSRSHLELRFHGVTRNSGVPEPPGTPGSRSPLDLRFPSVARNTGFLESPGTKGFRNPGTLGSRSQPDFRVPGVTRNSEFPESPRTTGSRSHPVLRVCESPGTPCSRHTRNYWFPESPEIRVSGFPEIRVPGVTWNSGFLGSPGTPDSRSNLEPCVPIVTRNCGSTE